MTDDELRDELATYSTRSVQTTLYRATLLERDPLVSSLRGGRWVPPGFRPVLYTSTMREGALAEMAFRLGLNTPLPTNPIKVHSLRATCSAVLSLSKSDLESLDVDFAIFDTL